MNTPTVYSSEFFVFDYDTYSPNSNVMAFNDYDGEWQSVQLMDVEEEPDQYTRFFFLDELPVPEQKNPISKAKRKIDELVSWINKWAVKSPAVDAEIQRYRDEIFQYLDEVTHS